MNKKLQLDINVWKILYYKYRDFLFPTGTILVCMLLIFFYAIPQIQNWFTIKDQVAADNSQIQILSQNLNTISLMDSNKIDSYVSLTTSALPQNKDFAGIVMALTGASVGSNVPIGDYGFQVGDVTKTQAVVTNENLGVTMNITLKGNISDLKRFVGDLKKEFPLSDITDVGISGSSQISMQVIFYYMPYNNGQISDTNPIQAFSVKEQQLLNTLSQTQQQQASVPDATPNTTVTASSSGNL